MTLVSPPTADPISLLDAKAFCRVTHDEEDTLFQALITASARHLERHLGVSISEQQWRLTLPCFAERVRLPFGPVISVDAVKYIDTNGIEQDLANGIYLEDFGSERQSLVRATEASLPATDRVPDAVSITYTAGISDIETHKDLWLALQFQIQHFYVRGMESANSPEIVKTLTQPYRQYYL